MTKSNYYLKIGETYRHRIYGTITPVKSQQQNCKGCVFNHGGACKDSTGKFICNSIRRPDKNNVIFVKQ